MSEDTADIVGTKDASFTFTISSGTISKATLAVPGQAKVPLAIGDSRREVTVEKLPAGDSSVRLDINWAPEDPDALVDVGTVTQGNVKSAAAKGILSSGDVPNVVELFGTGA